MCIYIPDNPPTPLHILIVVLIHSGLTCKGVPEVRNAPSQFIPFDPFLSGGMYCSAPHRLHALKFSLV